MKILTDRRRIPWQRRVNAFLTWRRLKQKIYPVSKDLNIARPTVKAIVEEFLDSGFSQSPRINLPVDTLRKLQDAHLKEISFSWKGGALPDLGPPEQYAHEADGQLKAIEVSTELTARPGVALVWHLKGTEIEETFSQALASWNDYDAQCGALWNDVASALTELRGLELIPIQYTVQKESNPCFYDNLVDLVYRRLFRILDEPIASGDSWVYWSRDEADHDIVMANHKPVAVEPLGKHGLIENAVETFFTGDGLNVYKGRAVQLRLYHNDLKYVAGLLFEETTKVDPDTLKEGICPWCPYPEALLIPWEDES